MNTLELRTRVLLTLQVALLSRVTSNMRSVLVSWSDWEVKVRVVFDEALSDDDIELTSEIESEVMSHLPDHSVVCVAEARSPLERVEPRPGEVVVFQRSGPR